MAGSGSGKTNADNNGGPAEMITLHPYQIDIATRGLAVLRAYHILYLSMQVRTGKSLTAMYAAQLYGATSVLFLTKKKAIGSIDSEEAQGDYQKLNPPFKMETINYEQAHKLRGEDYDFIICDEAHGLGAYPQPAKRVQYLKVICESKPIVFLSGTPSPESYSQLYHQFYISSWSPFAQYATFYKWAKDFVEVRKKYYYKQEFNDYSKADESKITPLVDHLFISFTQEEAGFTQEVQEEVIEVMMDQRTYKLASHLKRHKVYVGRSGEEILCDTPLKLMNKLHQIFSGTVLTEHGQGLGFDTTKARFIAEHFAGQKIAVFYKFRCEAVMLQTVFAGRWTESPEEFAKSDRLVFISQIQSGREGINLSTADCLVFMNIDFSAVSYWQARARLQSKDREKECKIYWVFAKGGIEKKIYEMVGKKKDYTLGYFLKDFNVKREAASA